MSAQDDLIRAFGRHASWAASKMLAESILRTRDRELAEKIRANKCSGTSPDDILCPCGEAAADLIDPDKE